jgi:subtilisin family serine protease
MKCRVAGRIAVVSLAAVSLAALATPAQAGEKIANSYICVFKNDRVAKADVPAKANAAATAHGGSVSHVYRTAIRGFSANISEAGMNAMRRNNPAIAYCEQDQVMTLVAVSAKAKPGGGTTTQPPQEKPWGIARVNGGGATSSATAWVIDTGIDLDHPDLNVDAGRSRNFVARETSPDDLNGHGSHVSGTIAARDNAIGVIGVAPGTTVVAVRVLDRRGSGSNSGVIAGVDYVAQSGRSGDVANMSLGGSVSTALDTAVINAAATGVRFALAAGNESDDANNHSPARANGPNIYTVSAFAQGDKWASFSNYGNPPIDYAEPGVSIKSTWKDGGYNTISGTSMATPHLAGLLLIGVKAGGAVTGDPDGNADTIGVH